jgi:hypothetical protein
MSLHFHIDRLTIEGASRSDGLRVSAALRHRLTELGARGLQPHGATIGHLDAGILPPGASPEATGHHLAGQIFRSLQGRRRR